MIFHIISKTDWEAAMAQGSYTPPSLSTEGFIHCSRLEQVAATAGRFYAGQQNLLLLRIEEDRLTETLHYEAGTDLPQQFPHIYGPLNLQAVTAIYEFKPGPDGQFILPQGIEEEEI